MAAAIIGPLLGAAGNIAGGMLSGGTGGTGKTAAYNPALDFALQAAQYSALDPLGFGSLSRIPDPLQELIGRIQSQPMDDKTRRRALVALENIRTDPTLLNDPFGAQFNRDQIFEANKTGDVPFGRVVTRGPEGSGIWNRRHAGGAGGGAAGAAVGGILGGPLAGIAGGVVGGTGKGLGSSFFPGNTPLAKALFGALGVKGDTEPTGLPIRNIGRLQSALRGAGMNLEDLQTALRQQAEHKAMLKRLEDAGIKQMNENTILNRARSAATAAELLGGAASFASTGQPTTPMGQTLLDRDNRMLQDLQDRLGLAAQFGGLSSASFGRSLSDARLDQTLRLVEQQLGMGNAIQAALNPATAAASSIAGQGATASANAAQIMAQQAMAANGLRQQGAIQRSQSLGSGIASGLGGLGSAISNQALLSNFYSNIPQSSGTSGPRPAFYNNGEF